MTRDDEFIRYLLFEAEKSDDLYLVAPMYLSPSPEDLKRHVHAELLCDAGLFQAVNEGVYRITNQGHDYIQVIKDKDIWEKTKASASKVGGVTLVMMRDIAVGYVKKRLLELGIPH